MITKFRQSVTFILCITMTIILTTTASAYNYNKNDVIYSSIPGDINGDRYVRANDARLCLRAAAKLDTLTDEQILAADLSGTGEVTSANARKILRASAGLETLNATITISAGRILVVGPLKDWGWEYSVDNNNLNITLTTEENYPSGVDGVATDKFYTISTNVPGSYTIHFFRQAPWQNEVQQAFSFTINVAK